MSNIVLNPQRVGAFTSSEIYRLMGSPKVAATYIEEKQIEKRLGRCLTKDNYSQDMAWGNFCEQRVHELLGLEYKLLSTETAVHPKYEFWAGSADLIVEGKKVSDIKCFQMKKFCQYTDALLTNDLDLIKAEFPAEYWQLISNAIINNVPNAEAITYCPYLSEIPILREMASNYDGVDQWKYRFIAEKPESGLAWLPDGGFYKNLNIFEFEVPQSDKDLLVESVLKVKFLPI
jgi:hypothetical protein